MGIMDTRKPGLSNNIAKQEGFPTSGEMSANAGALPAQRQQAPYEQNRAQTNMPQPTAQPPQRGGTGTLNGGAFQGAQYKLNAQPMSSGVASFVSIPQGAGGGLGFNAPKPSVPGSTPISLNMQQHPQFFAAQGQQGQQGQGGQQGAATPAGASAQGQQGAQPASAPNAAPAPSQPAQTTQPQSVIQTDTTVIPPAGAPTPTATPPEQSPMPLPGETQYDYDKRMAAMGSFYDIGQGYDKQQQAIMAEQARQQNIAGWAQNQLAGRGGNIAQVAQNYANTMAALQSDAARAQQAQTAHQQEFANRMAYNQAINKTKTDIAQMATELGLDMDEEDFNKLAAEVVGQYGANATPGSMMEAISKSTGAGSAKSAENKAQQISNILNKNDWDSESQLANIFKTMSTSELKAFYANKGNRGLLNQALATTWGQDNDDIRAAFTKAGIYDIGY